MMIMLQGGMRVMIDPNRTQISWVGEALGRCCTTSRNGKWGTMVDYLLHVDRQIIIYSGREICFANRKAVSPCPLRRAVHDCPYTASYSYQVQHRAPLPTRCEDRLALREKRRDKHNSVDVIKSAPSKNVKNNSYRAHLNNKANCHHHALSTSTSLRK